MMKSQRILLGLLLVLFLAALFPSRTAAQGEVNIYTHRHYEADEALFKTFTASTGIEVNVVKANADELIERLKAEGEASPADLLFTVDAGRLYKAKELGLLQAVESEVLAAAIPAQYRDPDSQWFGLTQRARVMVSRKGEAPKGLTSFEDLAKPEYRGLVLARSSSNIYNQSLLASIIVADGEEAAREWATAVRKNMARAPQGSDRDQVRAMAAGLGDVAIANTYYLGLLATSAEAKDRKVAEQVEIIWANQSGRGAHVNVSGAGVTKGSKNKDNAVKLLEFLASEESQKTYAETNFEYPVRAGTPWSDLLNSWGQFKADPLPLGKLGELNATAVKIFGEAGWE